MNARCPGCDQVLRVRPNQAGHTVRCRHCGDVFRLGGGISPTTRTTYVLLGLFLGSLGIHNFVTGRTAPAVGQLVLFLVSMPLMFFCIGFLTFGIPALWAVTEVLTVRHDGQGRLMA